MSDDARDDGPEAEKPQADMGQNAPQQNAPGQNAPRQERPHKDMPRKDETLFEHAADAEMLNLALGTYEGPLDMLLDLARAQKVDLREISVLALAEQYLAFIAAAKQLRLDVAAEYLVMAAWLAYLKSRLLLPKPAEDDEPTGEEMAAYLAFQLERLEGMRKAAEALFELPRLGTEFFPRGEPERRIISTRVEYVATQHELLLAYARQKTKENFKPLHLERRAVVAIDEALLRLRRAVGKTPDWEKLAEFLPEEWRDEKHARSAVASTFAAALELAKHGQVLIRQEDTFGPIFIRMREDAQGAAPATGAGDSAQARASRRALEGLRINKRDSAA